MLVSCPSRTGIGSIMVRKEVREQRKRKEQENPGYWGTEVNEN
jgi:hypothetical protein